MASVSLKGDLLLLSDLESLLNEFTICSSLAIDYSKSNLSTLNLVMLSIFLLIKLNDS